MRSDPPTAVSNANRDGVLLLAAILPVFYMRFVPAEKLLIATGVAVVAIGMFVIIRGGHSASATDMFVSALALFLMAVICKRYPALMAAGVGMWMWRNSVLLLFAGSERFSTFPFVAVVRFVAGFCAAVVLILWTGRYNFTYAFFASAIMAFFAVLADAGLNPKNRAPLAELAAVLAGVSVLGFNIGNLIYLQNPWFALLISLVSAVFVYKTGLLKKKVLWLFVVCATVIFTSLGWSGWILYLVFLLVCEAGWRGRKQNVAANPLRSTHKFAAYSFPAVLFSILSAGWDDPFIFYFAFAGSMSALAFQNLYYHKISVASGEFPDGIVSVRHSFSSGVIGITVIAACAVSSRFIPMGGLYILLLAGLSPMFSTVFRNVLAKPGRDAVWLTPLLGAAVAAVSTKLL